ncbi:hypothetical protein EYF80_058432 [Liparis tanakae]|uniref:Uncharacterized protein n=1 Tax=Liparis tanakae TaxID=230148 RepID=A0A4Z2ER71_9TELE|nr:hypothetical protein EYF80_058432 [Liparis tanakae]
MTVKPCKIKRQKKEERGGGRDSGAATFSNIRPGRRGRAEEEKDRGRGGPRKRRSEEEKDRGRGGPLSCSLLPGYGRLQVIHNGSNRHVTVSRAGQSASE